jgi:anti-sigma regulatory factor (Ser/Thr protein kinase)
MDERLKQELREGIKEILIQEGINPNKVNIIITDEGRVDLEFDFSDTELAILKHSDMLLKGNK